MSSYNDIGIFKKLDWPRIQRVFRLGFSAPP